MWLIIATVRPPHGADGSHQRKNTCREVTLWATLSSPGTWFVALNPRGWYTGASSTPGHWYPARGACDMIVVVRRHRQQSKNICSAREYMRTMTCRPMALTAD